MAGPSSGAQPFDAHHPERFYLPHDDLEWLADATLVVEGVRLPVHIAVLSLQSGVLRGLFVDMQTIETGSDRSRKRKQVRQKSIRLHDTFFATGTSCAGMIAVSLTCLPLDDTAFFHSAC